MRARVLTVTAVSGFAVASAALLGYLLFVGRRALVSTGGAHLQHWVDAEMARWLYLAMVVVLGAAFVTTVVLATRTAVDEGRPWRLGAATGAIVGILLGVGSLVTGAVATTVGPLTATVLVAYLAVLVGPLMIGGWVARATGRAGSGALAGFWFAVLLALSSGFAVVLRDTIFADRLVGGAWLLDHFSDQTCNNQTGDTLAACEIGDSFGAMASEWLLFPLLGAGLGALGGLVGRLTTTRRLAAPADRVPARVTTGLGVLLLVVLVAELTFQIW